MSAGRQRFSGRAAIVGVGSSAFSRDSGTTVMDLAATAVSEALADAGLAPADVDGILT
jgi:3-oxoacyl-[acyl-carrier-protein] synthase III